MFHVTDETNDMKSIQIVQLFSGEFSNLGSLTFWTLLLLHIIPCSLSRLRKVGEYSRYKEKYVQSPLGEKEEDVDINSLYSKKLWASEDFLVRNWSSQETILKDNIQLNTIFPAPVYSSLTHTFIQPWFIEASTGWLEAGLRWKDV